MKKKVLMLTAVMAACASLATGCSNSPAQENAGQETQQTEMEETGNKTETTPDEAAEQESQQAEMEETGNEAKTAPDEAAASEKDDPQASTLSGTVEEIKDFMFIVVGQDGTGYVFPFEEKPEGLDSIETGDTVKVTYTGTISEFDPFEGEVLSVEKE